MPDKTVYRGLLGLTSVEDFWNGKIKTRSNHNAEKRKVCPLSG